MYVLCTFERNIRTRKGSLLKNYTKTAPGHCSYITWIDGPCTCIYNIYFTLESSDLEGFFPLSASEIKTNKFVNWCYAIRRKNQNCIRRTPKKEDADHAAMWAKISVAEIGKAAVSYREVLRL